MYACINLFILLITARLFYIQAVKPFNNADLQNRVRTLTEEPLRGRILDRQGNILATNQLNYLLFANPRQIENPKETAKKIGEVLGMESASLEAKLISDKAWVPLLPNVNKAQKDKLTELKLKGIGLESDNKRLYKEASLAAHVLGFVGKNDEGKNVGYYGIEAYYDKELAGLTGRIRSERDAHGKPILVGKQETIEAVQGADVALTIDGAVQRIAKEKLKQGIERYGAKSGCIILANPNTMEILSLVCLPDFDQNNYRIFPPEYFKNPAVSESYEPGSTFKPLVVAAAIDKKILNENDPIEEHGKINIGDYTIETWDKKYEGVITVTRVLEKSSNVGMVKIGEKLGKQNLLEYIKKYGFGTKTGIELQGEIAPPLRKDKDWRETDYATATFGQGIATTPLQMVRAFASLINGGKLMAPHIVKSVSQNGKTITIEPQQVSQVISSETSSVMRRVLKSTVEHGEYKWRIPQGYTFGGKTGTAQIAVNGVYDEQKTIASFIGFTPTNNPQLIGMVLLKEPTSSPWGSETAAPLYFEFMKDVISYYNMAPEQ